MGIKNRKIWDKFYRIFKFELIVLVFENLGPLIILKSIVSEYDQEISQSQTTWHRAEEPLNHHETTGRQIKQSNQLSLPHQDDCNTRMDMK